MRLWVGAAGRNREVTLSTYLLAIAGGHECCMADPRRFSRPNRGQKRIDSSSDDDEAMAAPPGHPTATAHITSFCPAQVRNVRLELGHVRWYPPLGGGTLQLRWNSSDAMSCSSCTRADREGSSACSGPSSTDLRLVDMAKLATTLKYLLFIRAACSVRQVAACEPATPRAMRFLANLTPPPST